MSDDKFDLDAWLNSPETQAELARLDAKEKAREEKRRAKQESWEAARAERIRNPQTPVDAYFRHMSQCPFPSFSKERKQWTRENPSFEFAGVTWTAHWSYQLSNSGKSGEFEGWLHGSDGARVPLREVLKNRRNDPDRNWGLGRE